MKNVKKVNLDGLCEYIAMYEKIVKETQKKKYENSVIENQLIDVINKLIESGDLFSDIVKKRKEQKNTSEYKSLATKKNEIKKELYLLDLGKKVVKHNLENLLELKTMECIALNWESLKGVPFHYKKYSNIINESLSAEGLGYRVYYDKDDNKLKINNFYDPELKGFKRESIDSCIYLYGDNYNTLDVYDRKYHIDTIKEIIKDIKTYGDRFTEIMKLKKQYEKNVSDIVYDVSVETIKRDLLDLNAWGCWEWEA